MRRVVIRRQVAIRGTAVAMSVLGVWLIVTYAAWKSERVSQLETGSLLIQTERGLMEYALQGKGPAVLVLHGTLGGYDQGILTAKALGVDTEFQFVAVSRPGYLRTPLSTGKMVDEQAEAYAVLLDALGIRQVAIIAESGGGLSAIPFVLRHPERCRALVLLSANTRRPVKSSQETSHDLLVRLLGSDLGDFGQWGYFNLLKRKPDWFMWPIESDPGLRCRLLDDPLKWDLFLDLFNSIAPLSHRMDGALQDAQILATYADYPLQDITCPTLVVHGSADWGVPVVEAEQTALIIPQAEFIRVEGADHWVLITHRDELLPKVIEFLKAHQ